jgi:hypothetical protein
VFPAIYFLRKGNFLGRFNNIYKNQLVLINTVTGGSRGKRI